jgi:NADPH-dependent curcumin reductase CurA
VTASEHAGFAVGEDVYGAFGVQDFARSDGSGVSKLDPDGLLKLFAGENLGKLVLAVQ